MAINPTQIYQQMLEAGEDWADKEAAASLLEETKKSLRSSLATEKIQQGESAAASEAHAEASEQYRQHLEDMVEARRLANRARVKWISVQTYNKLIQTKEATARAEMQLR